MRLTRFLILAFIVSVLAFTACSKSQSATPQPDSPVESKPIPRQQAALSKEAVQSEITDAAYMAMPAPMPYPVSDTARYEHYADNPAIQAAQQPLSTFSLNVGTASYANTRRFLEYGSLPNPDAVRTEELLNYFSREDDLDKLVRLGASPFKAAYELAPCPWNKNNVLLYLTLKTNDLAGDKMPPANLVFLVDSSGSMYSEERLPLVIATLKMLTEELRREDRISIVTYSGSTEVVLEATPGSEKAKIRAALSRLEAGGGTAGGAGLALAYEQAEKAFIKGGVNRILLCTDGDFNLGVSSTEELTAMVTRQRDKGITLSVLGYGTDNLNDSMMVSIADNGNGNYSYIDSLSEARKVLGEEMHATLVTVAKDVKAQIEFNPKTVLEYRQIGYELRQLAAEDFNDDRVDAGDIGAGKDVTILYELTLAGSPGSLDPLRYQDQPQARLESDFNNELAFVKLRWKDPKALEDTGMASQLVSLPILKSQLAASFDSAGQNIRFYAAVAAYGQKLRNNPSLSGTDWGSIATWANTAKGKDSEGYKREFVKLVKLAGSLAR